MRKALLAIARHFEDWLATVVLLLLGALPVLQAIIRAVAQGGIPGYNGYLVHLVLAAAFLGGMITAREGRHLAIKIVGEILPDRAKPIADAVTAFLSSALTFAFFLASLSFVLVGFEPGSRVGFIRTEIFAAVMPVGFLVMSIRFVLGASRKRGLTVVAASGLVLGAVIGYSAIASIIYTYANDIPAWVDGLYNAWYAFMDAVTIPLIVVLIASAFAAFPCSWFSAASPSCCSGGTAEQSRLYRTRATSC